MEHFDFTLRNSIGLQAKASCTFTTLANRFKSEIYIRKINPETRTADAKDILAILSLRIVKGDTIRVTMEGPDEKESLKELSFFLKCL